MNRLGTMMAANYRRCLGQPITIIFVVAVLCGFAALYAPTFEFDASADTLISKHDPELEYFRKLSEQFGDSDFLVMTYTPNSGELFTRKHMDRIARLVAALAGVNGVRSVNSLLDAPLLKSPSVPLMELASGFRTLKDPTSDLHLAQIELTQSPLFKELLVSADGRSTAIKIDLDGDPELEGTRRALDTLAANPKRSAAEEADLVRLTHRYRALHEVSKTRRARLVAEIRGIRNGADTDVQLYLGGVPLVVADMIDYVKQDMQDFSVGVLLLITISLYVFFRRLRWVLIPLATTAVTLLLTIGLLGFLHQPATAISANFVSLLAIISISFTVHLITRYRELVRDGFSEDHTDIVYEAMSSKLAPCVYTGLTTAVAFASLVTSDIVPVIAFGWIMCVGIGISFLVAYSFFASVLILLPKGVVSQTLHAQPWATQFLCRITLNHSSLVLGVAILSLVVSAFGISQLSINNRFIDYFKEGSEIHDGMTFIDRYLGGTIPLEIVIDVPPFVEAASDDDVVDEFVDDFADSEPESFPEKYWYTPQNLHLLSELHTYLDSRPEVGKSVSLARLEQVARAFNDGNPLDSLMLVSVLSAVPDNIRNTLIDPYGSPSTGELRISARIHETGTRYSHEELIQGIQRFATNELGIDANRVHVTGMAVLFNGMLSQLFKSQASTLIFVIFATLAMFTLLLRSFRLGLIGLVPNLLAAAIILGFMGLAGISLDIMTITIAAIVIGIGVDDAIHYLHRFKERYAVHGRAKLAIVESHDSIGQALYFTSFTVIVGFSILALSNFVPTVTFGLLTALAMALALIANLTVLPSLLLKLYAVDQTAKAKLERVTE